jgi:hypothetical protein
MKRIISRGCATERSSRSQVVELVLMTSSASCKIVWSWSNVVDVLDFLMGCESYLRDQPENIVIRFVSLSLVYFYVFEFESSRRFQFSLVYRSALAQIFPRSHPMRESNISTNVYVIFLGVLLCLVSSLIFHLSRDISSVFFLILSI